MLTTAQREEFEFKCGTSNPAESRFCNGCAAPLTAGSTTLSARSNEPGIQVNPEQSDSSSAPDGERKTVTALFADIKVSTELMRDLDPEEARAIIDPALKLMIDGVHRYDGYVVQSTGDGIFALFGAPVAHEDHPQRALYAALRMQEEMRRYGERMRAPRAVRPNRRRISYRSTLASHFEQRIRSPVAQRFRTSFITLGGIATTAP
jgi:class 3 adenylate cyclase